MNLENTNSKLWKIINIWKMITASQVLYFKRWTIGNHAVSQSVCQTAYLQKPYRHITYHWKANSTKSLTLASISLLMVVNKSFSLVNRCQLRPTHTFFLQHKSYLFSRHFTTMVLFLCTFLAFCLFATTNDIAHGLVFLILVYVVNHFSPAALSTIS